MPTSSTAAHASGTAEQGRPPSEAKPVLLVVDDSATACATMREILEPKFEVRIARDGLEALKAMRLSPPDVVICDGEMPRLKVFDPFFTTKEVGRGTGQGLAIARSIMRKHDGSISFTTKRGEGTTFHIRIPIEPRARPREGTAAGSAPRAAGEAQG